MSAHHSRPPRYDVALWGARAVGMMAACWGGAMLLANRSSPDPLAPGLLVLALVIGLALLGISYVLPRRGSRWRNAEVDRAQPGQNLL